MNLATGTGLVVTISNFPRADAFPKLDKPNAKSSPSDSLPDKNPCQYRGSTSKKLSTNLLLSHTFPHISGPRITDPPPPPRHSTIAPATAGATAIARANVYPVAGCTTPEFAPKAITICGIFGSGPPNTMKHLSSSMTVFTRIPRCLSLAAMRLLVSA
ncbi:multifunctional 2-oxoglutarate metabolism enzyme [Striga asiatica]|uniref:Multifunctional 2-oxoglutarate metabolism enzyme n=1 Tax=Striga asiatica TaxID=4170 RepID=A0A5A7NYQ3_STRAF|nr:multifunctional 2-oxoglutarate metabolism enzyme [Striga asiatica]